MDPTLYNKIYKDGVDKETILKYTEYLKPRHLHHLIKDYVWRAKLKVKSKGKASIIKVNQ